MKKTIILILVGIVAQDAHTKNTFNMKHALCADCQKTLKKITF